MSRAGEQFVHQSYQGFQRIRNTGARARSYAQRGAGKLKAILTTAILLIAVFAAYKIVPAYVTDYELSDKMQEQARFAVVNRYNDEQIRDNIFKVVQDLEIQGVKRDDIKVTATQAVVKISLEYTVPVNLGVYSTELHFSPSSENKSLM
jgi:hypothetical protein